MPKVSRLGKACKTRRFTSYAQDGLIFVFKDVIMPKKILIFVVLSTFGLMGLSRPVESSTKRILLLPLAVYSPQPQAYLRNGLMSMLGSRLSVEGLQIVPLSKDSQAKFSKKEKAGVFGKDRAKELGEALRANYVVFGSVTIVGKGYSLDLSLLDLTKNPPKLIHISRATTEDQFIPILAEIANEFRSIVEGRYPPAKTFARGPKAASSTGSGSGPFRPLGETGGYGSWDQGLFRPTAQGYHQLGASGRYNLRLSVMSIDAYDLTNNGHPEILILSRNELRIYSKEGASLRLLDVIKARRGEDLLKISIGDVDSNGTPEIYVAGFYRGQVYTTVYDWKKKPIKRFEKSGHLFVSGKRGSKTYLLYQDSSQWNLFKGPVYFMRYNSDGHLVKATKLPRLTHLKFYTLVPYDINKDGAPELIGLGEGNTLHIWDLSGETLFQDDEPIGGTNNAIDLAQVTGQEELPRVPFNSRLVLADVNGDGKADLIAPKNLALVGVFEHFKYYDSGYVLAYKIEGTKLEKNWTSPKLRYCVTDMQMLGNTLFVALQKLQLKNYAKGYSHLVWFNLGKK